MPQKKNKLIRSGKWPGTIGVHSQKIPSQVQIYMELKNPDWDWAEVAVDGKEWLIIREYDEGQEQSRVAALVQARKDFTL